MASIHKRPRKDGSTAYMVVYLFPDGRQGGLTYDDPKLAERFRLSVEVHGAQRALELENVDPEPRRHSQPGGQTVGEWVRHHIDHLTGKEQYTLDVYNRYLENDIAPFLGDIPLTALREEDIARWVKHMETTPSPKTGRVVAPKTISNKHGFLSGALNAAVRTGRIPANPCAGRDLPRKTRDDDDDDDGDIRMLSPDEYDRLLDAGTVPYWRPLIQFLVASGCRWGEATALRPRDVNRSAGTVRIHRAVKNSSKGYTIGPTKTEGSKRTINLPAEVLDQLNYTGEWLFTNTAGRPVRYHPFKTNVWNRAVKAAGLEPPPSPHALRHTCASWMLNAGVPMLTVSRHLGHQNVLITTQIYGHVDRTSHAAAADVMAQLLHRDKGDT